MVRLLKRSTSDGVVLRLLPATSLSSPENCKPLATRDPCGLMFIIVTAGMEQHCIDGKILDERGDGWFRSIMLGDYWPGCSQCPSVP